MNEDGINRQGWFAISLGSVFIIGLIFVLLGGGGEAPANDQTSTRPSQQTRTSSPEFDRQRSNTETKELNLIQNLIQQGQPPAQRDRPEIISVRDGFLGTITAALSQTVETVVNLTQTVISKILPDDEVNPATEPLIPNINPSGSASNSLIQEEEIFDPSQPRLIEGANPLLID